jgi:hypothetical protein
MAERSGARRRPSGPQPGPGRFDASIHPGRGMKDLTGLDAIPLDRMPGQPGRARALVTADEIVQLLDLGFEVRLHTHLPIQGLDAGLITTDAALRRTLEKQFASVRPAQGRTRPSKKRKA